MIDSNLVCVVSAEAADQLGTNGKLVERLVEWCEAKDHAGVMGESNRLLSALIRHSKSKVRHRTLFMSLAINPVMPAFGLEQGRCGGRETREVEGTGACWRSKDNRMSVIAVRPLIWPLTNAVSSYSCFKKTNRLPQFASKSALLLGIITLSQLNTQI